MKRFLKLVIVSTLLLNVAHCASLATANDNCTATDGFHEIQCLIRINDFTSKIEDLNMKDKGEIKVFNNTCNLLASCFKELGKCKADRSMTKDIEEVPKLLKIYCEAIIYISNDFANCTDKLEKNNSACFKEWEPFPDSVDEEMDENKKIELKKKACEHFFGRDNCLEKEITDTCSEKEWTDFKEYFIRLNVIMKQCDAL